MARRQESNTSVRSRRKFVKAVAATGAASFSGLAGCMGGDGGDGSSGDGGGGDGGVTTSRSSPSGVDYEVEDTLVIYSPVPEDLIPWFEEETGITVELVTDAGPRTTARFFQEQSSGQYNADILFGPTSTFLPNPGPTVEHTQTITEFDVDRNDVMPDELYEKWESKIPSDIFDRFMPTHTLTNRLFAVADDLENPPTSYDHLLESRFEGNIVAQPFFMDTNIGILERALGSLDAAREYMTSLKEQDLLIQIEEIGPVIEGQVTVSFLATDNAGSVTRMSQGAPITLTFPEEGVPMVADTYVMAKNAPHPGAARRFLELQFSQPAQEFIAQSSGGQDPIRPEIPHGNQRMRELIENGNRFPMMLSADEISQYQEIAGELWPDIST